MFWREGTCAAVFAAAFSAYAGQVCDLSFTECPGRLAGGVVKIPPEIIRLDARIPFCSEVLRLPAEKSKPLSLVFVIDNSGSMDENDPKAARFDVVSSLLDNLRSLAPAAEVGLVIFTRRLSFDHRENPFFRTAFPGDSTQHDSFAPLTALDRVFPDGRTGLDTLKALLRHDAQGNLTHNTRLPASRRNPVVGPGNTRDGTDISLGFMAAKIALADAKADPARRYVVFLSDGMPATPDAGREALAEEFVAGNGVPATFTIFFDTRNSIPRAPENLVAMTANIRRNGYSETNPKSAYWAINEPGAELDQVLRANVFGSVLAVTADPVDARVAWGDTAFPVTGSEGRDFLLPRGLNLKTDTTRFTVDYTYSYVDSSGETPVPRRTQASYAVTLVRSPTAPLPQGLGATCREQPAIGLFRDGQPITTVTIDDAELEARVIPQGGSLCPGCRLEALSGRARDRELLPLSAAGAFLSAPLRPEESASAAPGDGRLQHGRADSIVIQYFDPENPLDRVRKAYPYRGAPTVLGLGYDGTLARPQARTVNPFLPQFAFIAPAGFRAAPRGPDDRWSLQSAPPPSVSVSSAGVMIEASRAFSAELRVYSNLGEAVNKLEFTVGQEEFEKLETIPGSRSRLLRIRWDGRARGGAAVATGAYILKASIRLLRIPGLAEDPAEKTEWRRVGVLRSL